MWQYACDTQAMLCHTYFEHRTSQYGWALNPKPWNVINNCSFVKTRTRQESAEKRLNGCSAQCSISAFHHVFWLLIGAAGMACIMLQLQCKHDRW